MKILDKIGLVVFSTIILLVGVVAILTIIGWMELELIIGAIEFVITGEIASKITLGVSIVLILLAIKCIFFSSNDETEKSEGILLENENGKLLISVETIENLIKGVVSGFANVKSS